MEELLFQLKVYIELFILFVIVKCYIYYYVLYFIIEELEDKMSYKSGMKSYKIYGFTDKNNIDLEYFYKSATHVILPSSETNVCCILSYCFIYVKKLQINILMLIS